MRKFIVLALCAAMVITPFGAAAQDTAGIYPYDVSMPAFWFTPAAADYTPQSDAKAMLLMEYSTGRVLFARDEKEHLPIASVTKVMSTLLIVEALDEGRISLDDSVTVSGYAASMGGSQIFLEEGEQITVGDLLKSLVVVSANDAAVALGEYLCGSESSFVSEMNERAEELGCENTHFVNTNGLPAEDHYSCALDVALITRELMTHRMIFDYSGIWTDTIRNGSFGLANTNKLIRFYKGATGMKTGFTQEAGFCLSGTAERDGMQLIAVVLGCPTSDARFSAVKNMLDYGFANYCVTVPEPPELKPLHVTRGVEPEVALEAKDVTLLTDKAQRSAIECVTELPDSLPAPVSEGDVVGRIVYTAGGQTVGVSDVIASETVEEVGYFSLLVKLLSAIFRL